MHRPWHECGRVEVTLRVTELTSDMLNTYLEEKADIDAYEVSTSLLYHFRHHI